AAEQAYLPALRVRREEVDHLDPRLEDLLRRGELLGLRRRAVNRPAVVALPLVALVDRVSEQVEDAAAGLPPGGPGDRAAGVDPLVAAAEALGRVHRHRAHAVVAEVLLDLADEGRRRPALGLRHADLERVVDLRQVVREVGVDDNTRYLLDGADV